MPNLYIFVLSFLPCQIFTNVKSCSMLHLKIHKSVSYCMTQKWLKICKILCSLQQPLAPQAETAYLQDVCSWLRRSLIALGKTEQVVNNVQCYWDTLSKWNANFHWTAINTSLLTLDRIRRGNVHFSEYRRKWWMKK